MRSNRWLSLGIALLVLLLAALPTYADAVPSALWGAPVQTLYRGSDGVWYAGLYHTEAVYRSTDHGVNWSAYGSGISPSDVMVIAEYGGALWAGTWGGGVFRRTPGEAAWAASNTGISASYRQIQGMAVDTASGTLYAADRRRVVYRYNPGTASWSELSGNSTLPSTANIRTLFVHPSERALYAGLSDTGGGLFRYDAAARRWDRAGLDSIAVRALAIGPEGSFWAATDNGVYRRGAGGAWQAVGDSASWGTRITALAHNPLYPYEVAAGTEDGRIRLWHNGSASWQALDVPDLAGQWVWTLGWTRVEPQRLLIGSDGGLYTATPDHSFPIRFTAWLPSLATRYDPLQPPLTLRLIGQAIEEGNALDQTIGSLSVQGLPAGTPVTYALANDPLPPGGPNDNASFRIVGDQLRAMRVFDYETKTWYRIGVRATWGATGRLDAWFPIKVRNVNEPPVLTVPPPQSTLEDTPLRLWGSTGSSVADVDAFAKPLMIALSAQGGALTLNTPGGVTFLQGDGVLDAEVSFTGTITQVNVALADLLYTPTADVNGAYTLTAVANDLGNTGIGGLQVVTATIPLAITAVNDAPSFAPGPDVAVLEDSGSQVIPAWATDIIAGPPDEAATQSLWFEVEAGEASLFAALPTLDVTGTLRFTPADDANGSSVITVTLRDDGGTAYGGVDASPPVTFTLAITAANEAPTIVSPPPLAAVVGVLYQYELAAYDPDDDPADLFFSAVTCPDWLTLTDHGDGTATLSGTPDAADVGAHDVEIVISDGKASSSQAFTIQVATPGDRRILATRGLRWAMPSKYGSV